MTQPVESTKPRLCGCTTDQPCPQHAQVERLNRRSRWRSKGTPTAGGTT